MFSAGNGIFNTASGTFTAPQSGYYNIGTNVTVETTNQTTFTVTINVNGIPVATNVVTVGAGLTQTIPLAISYPLMCGQNVQVMVTADAAGASVLNNGTNLSLFMPYSC